MTGSARAFEVVCAYNTYNLYNRLYNVYNKCTYCFCSCSGLRLFGSEQHWTGSDRGSLRSCQPPGEQIRSTGKNTSSFRVIMALWSFVLYGKNVVVKSLLLISSLPSFANQHHDSDVSVANVEFRSCQVAAVCRISNFKLNLTA